MESAGVEDMSVNSWKSMPLEERKKIILDIRAKNNKIGLEIDDRQKKLVDLRCTIPDECEELLRKEKATLLEHVKNGPLFPELAKRGLGEEEKETMVKQIEARVAARVVDSRQTKEIIDQTEERNQENEALRQRIRELSESLLKKINK